MQDVGLPYAGLEDMKRSLVVMMLASALALGADVPRGHLPEPDYLPKLARKLLRERMLRHGDDMTQLVLGVTLLQRDRVKAIATDIANEPRLVRPMPGDEDSLNAALPNQLFVLQEELRLRAKALSAAADKPNDRRSPRRSAGSPRPASRATRCSCTRSRRRRTERRLQRTGAASSACSLQQRGHLSGGRRPQPHWSPPANGRYHSDARAMRWRAPVSPSAACTTPR